MGGSGACWLTVIFAGNMLVHITLFMRNLYEAGACFDKLPAQTTCRTLDTEKIFSPLQMQAFVRNFAWVKLTEACWQANLGLVAGVGGQILASSLKMFADWDFRYKKSMTPFH